ncbi:hypothetical protein H4219_002405 [Mycoemilia scoparia]|uniref:Splicing factor U2AF subunit n=1 Tax=Mycoemilia scoparia TaxID=417184 RepID=A0A9W8DU44_9FUNG|nr:hypothetical protein H4219_002405 [Mycoemilia scoparia]
MNLWDQVPPGFENVPASQAKLTGYFPPPGQLVGSRNVASFNPSVLQSQREGEKIDPKKQAMLKQNRRIYVGNIPYGINEASVWDAIAHFFNSTMIDLGIASRDEPPVQSVQINVEKNYAFVEFRNPEQATRGMALDGANFQSQSLKIRRPKDYIPPEGQPEVIQPIHIPGVVSTNVADTPFKIYVGGLPTTLQEDQVIELLSTFGELRSFNLVKDNLTGMSRGFAFCEYLDTNITDVACQGLNGMELGDRRLVVQRASIGARQNNPPPGMNPALGAGPMAPPPLIPAGMSSAGGEPTNILQLLNMVTPEELQDDDEYMDIVEDVKEECSKFGQVIDIRIPRPDSEKEVPGVGKIFVVYPNTQQSGLAHNALAGRKFADRTVLVSYITQENYDNENY